MGDATKRKEPKKKKKEEKARKRSAPRVTFEVNRL